MLELGAGSRPGDAIAQALTRKGVRVALRDIDLSAASGQGATLWRTGFWA